MNNLKSVKAFLRTAYDAQQKIEADKALLERARAQAEGAQCVRYDKINVSGGRCETPALERAALEKGTYRPARDRVGKDLVFMRGRAAGEDKVV